MVRQYEHDKRTLVAQVVYQIMSNNACSRPLQAPCCAAVVVSRPACLLASYNPAPCLAPLPRCYVLNSSSHHNIMASASKKKKEGMTGVIKLSPQKQSTKPTATQETVSEQPALQQAQLLKDLAKVGQGNSNLSPASVNPHLCTVGITAQHRLPSFLSPDNAQGRTLESNSTGVVVNADRGYVLTTAGAVHYARQVEVILADSTDRYAAEVLAVGQAADLALLCVQGTAFRRAVKAVQWGSLPSLNKEVSTAGFSSNQGLVFTKGVASRIEVVPYAHGGQELLAIQIDAPVNQGCFGGPVFDDHGLCLGLMLQRSSADSWRAKYCGIRERRGGHDDDSSDDDDHNFDGLHVHAMLPVRYRTCDGYQKLRVNPQGSKQSALIHSQNLLGDGSNGATGACVTQRLLGSSIGSRSRETYNGCWQAQLQETASEQQAAGVTTHTIETCTNTANAGIWTLTDYQAQAAEPHTPFCLSVKHYGKLVPGTSTAHQVANSRSIGNLHSNKPLPLRYNKLSASNQSFAKGDGCAEGLFGAQCHSSVEQCQQSAKRSTSYQAGKHSILPKSGSLQTTARGKDRQNIAYVVPACVVKQFLRDMKSGSCRGPPQPQFEWRPLRSPALKLSLGVKPSQSGILVIDSQDTQLQKHDVITHVHGQCVGDDGTLALGDDGLRMSFTAAFSLNQVGQHMPLTIVRAGRCMDISIELCAREVTKHLPVSTSRLFPVEPVEFPSPNFVRIGPVLFGTVTEPMMRELNRQKVSLATARSMLNLGRAYGRICQAGPVSAAWWVKLQSEMLDAKSFQTMKDARVATTGPQLVSSMEHSVKDDDQVLGACSYLSSEADWQKEAGSSADMFSDRLPADEICRNMDENMQCGRVGYLGKVVLLQLSSSTSDNQSVSDATLDDVGVLPKVLAMVNEQHVSSLDMVCEHLDGLEPGPGTLVSFTFADDSVLALRHDFGHLVVKQVTADTV